MQALITEINGWAWGVPMQVLLLGTGVFLTVGLGFLTWIRLGLAFRMLVSGTDARGDGDILTETLSTSSTSTGGEARLRERGRWLR